MDHQCHHALARLAVHFGLDLAGPGLLAKRTEQSISSRTIPVLIALHEKFERAVCLRVFHVAAARRAGGHPRSGFVRVYSNVTASWRRAARTARTRRRTHTEEATPAPHSAALRRPTGWRSRSQTGEEARGGSNGTTGTTSGCWTSTAALRQHRARSFGDTASLGRLGRRTGPIERAARFAAAAQQRPFTLN